MMLYSRAWAIGTLLLVLVHIVWFSILKMHVDTSFTTYFSWLGVVASSSIAGLLAPNKKFLIGMSLAIPAALISGASNLIYEKLGNAVDFPGLEYSLLLVVLAFPWHLVLCAAGGGIAYFFAKASRL